MDEVFSALGGGGGEPTQSCPPSLLTKGGNKTMDHDGEDTFGLQEAPLMSPLDADVNNVRNEIREMALSTKHSKKKQAMVRITVSCVCSSICLSIFY